MLTAYMPNLMDTPRNNFFRKVVSDRQFGNTQLTGLTDDLVIGYEVNDDEDVVYGVWESEIYDECCDAMKVLKRWKGLKCCYHGRTELETLLRM